MYKQQTLLALFFLTGIFLTCANNIVPSKETIERVESLKELYTYPPGTHVLYCNLSSQNITTMPNLSMYQIDTLDLSHNAIKDIDSELVFPLELISLDLSYNKIGDLWYREKGKRYRYRYSLHLQNEVFSKLSRLNLSHNYIYSLTIPLPVTWLDASRNRLEFFDICAIPHMCNLQYLDLSYNWNLSRIFLFDTSKIPTLKRDSCARNQEFVFAKHIAMI